ncbi:MAG: hypothetical protein ABIZ70_11820 [Gemmatimonadales bacterium]
MATEREELDSRLAEAVRGLRDTPPAADLWPEIAPRLQPRRIAGTVRLRWPTALAAGLAIAVASVGGTLAVLRRAEVPPAVVKLPKNTGVPVVSVALASPADTTLETAIVQLEATLQTLQAKLDPASRESLNRSLRVLDRAIADASEQRRAEPEDPRAARYLTATLRKKLDVLRTVTVLASARS